METFHIHIRGRVQGVGFRPFVYQMAKERNIKGWVCNATDGVHIRFNEKLPAAKNFYEACLANQPRLAQITHADFSLVDDEYFDDFRIVESQNTELHLDMAPDFAMCPACRAEMKDKADPRHAYGFITCTHCGPRFSISKSLPYDRHLTTMASFQMCKTCEDEYQDVTDRRHFSQTNSCETCGVQTTLYNGKGERHETAVIEKAAEVLRTGKIIAIKGIGGFLIICDARSENAIRELRLWKHRPAKPFAVLYPGITAIEEDFVLRTEERETLLGPESPIVLLPFKQEINLPVQLIAPELKELGVMIPYAPLLELITSQFQGPLIATSANLGGAPILYEEDETSLLALTDWVLTHNRPIHFPVDDSVVRYTANEDRIVLRRARGLAPSVTGMRLSLPNDTLALGAEMKGAFAISANHNTYVSQYLGNLSSYENQVQYRKVLDGFVDLVKPTIKKVVVDTHPSYFTHQLGHDWASELGVAIEEVQHHEAHFAAILAEHDLFNERVLGMIWDGTGLGTDGHTWGGECFQYHDGEITRIAHQKYFVNLANDRMARDNRLCALAVSGKVQADELRSGFSDQEWSFYSKALQKQEQLSSSMGRLFDAVAFLAGVSESNAYEGQAAMLLEKQARIAFQKEEQLSAYSFSIQQNEICFDQTLNQIFQERREGRLENIGARFHLTLVAVIKEVALRGNYKKLAFSGGVFQNALLVDLITAHLGEQFELYFHRQLSPNDENIAFGQLAHSQYLKKKKILNQKTIEQCV